MNQPNGSNENERERQVRYKKFLSTKATYFTRKKWIEKLSKSYHISNISPPSLIQLNTLSLRPMSQQITQILRNLNLPRVAFAFPVVGHGAGRARFG